MASRIERIQRGLDTDRNGRTWLDVINDVFNATYPKKKEN